jgi:hypothetical protein
MTIHLKPELEALIQRDVERGPYQSVDEFVERWGSIFTLSGAGVFYHGRVYSHRQGKCSYVVNLVSLWRRCGVEPGRDEGAAV